MKTVFQVKRNNFGNKFLQWKNCCKCNDLTGKLITVLLRKSVVLLTTILKMIVYVNVPYGVENMATWFRIKIDQIFNLWVTLTSKMDNYRERKSFHKKWCFVNCQQRSNVFPVREKYICLVFVYSRWWYWNTLRTNSAYISYIWLQFLRKLWTY